MVNRVVASTVIGSKLFDIPNYRNIIQAMNINSKAFEILNLSADELDNIRKDLLNELDLWMMDCHRFSPCTEPTLVTETDMDITLDFDDIYNITFLSRTDVRTKEFEPPFRLPIIGFKDIIKPEIEPYEHSASEKVVAWELMYKNKFGSKLMFLTDGIPNGPLDIHYSELRKVRAWYQTGL